MRFNRLTDAEDERLSLLMEECAEVIQIAAKVKRHGYASANPDGDPSLINRELLESEIGHVLHAVDRMTLVGDVGVRQIHAEKVRKADRIGRYLHHQHEDIALRPTPEEP